MVLFSLLACTDYSSHSTQRGSSNIYVCQTSLVVQWIRIHLLMHRTWIWALLREDSIRCGATKPMYQTYWGRELQLLRPSAVITEACEPLLRNKKSQLQLESSAHLLQLEKARVQQWRPSIAKRTNKKQQKTMCDLVTHLLKTIQWLAHSKKKKKVQTWPTKLCSMIWSLPIALMSALLWSQASLMFLQLVRFVFPPGLCTCCFLCLKQSSPGSWHAAFFLKNIFRKYLFIWLWALVAAQGLSSRGAWA